MLGEDAFWKCGDLSQEKESVFIQSRLSSGEDLVMYLYGLCG